MKPIHYILICCLLGLSSCGQLDNLAQFNKRKYHKKPPKQRVVGQVITPEADIYASTDITPEAYVLEEIPEIDVEQDLWVVSDSIKSEVDLNNIIIEQPANILTQRVDLLIPKAQKLDKKFNFRNMWWMVPASILTLALFGVAVRVLVDRY